MIFRNPKGDELGAFLDVRGWGSLRHLFKTEDEAAAFQDNVGQFITDAINTALATVQLDQPRVDLKEILQWATDELKDFDAEIDDPIFMKNATSYTKGVNLGCRSILKDVITKLNDLTP